MEETDKILSAFRSFFCLFLLSFICLNVSGQKAYSITGTLLDSTHVPVPGATVAVSALPQKTLAGFSFSDEQGRFAVALDTAGHFEVKVTYIGYGTFVREVTLSESDLGELSLGSIILSENVHLLNGVTVEARFRPIVIKNDTIEYDADSFHAGEGATVEDLLRKLPGITVEEDGTVKSQGEEVRKVLVDGKEFFDNDPKIATRNIPAEVVDKVQVFDEPSDFTKFTGIKDGEDEKAINLAIKEGKNKGTFGELKVEYGAENRYNTGGSINRFTKRMQFSAIGNVNNTSEQSFDIQDLLSFSGGTEGLLSGEIDLSDLPLNLLRQRGITSSRSGGLNFNYDLNDRTELRSNYLYSSSMNTTTTSSNVGNLLGNASFINNGNNDDVNELESHRIKLSLEHAFSEKQALTVRLGGSLATPFVSSRSNTLTIRADTVVNRFNTNSELLSNIDRWNGQLLYRLKLNKAGRFFTTDLALNGERNTGQGSVLSDFGLITFGTLQQQQLNSGDELGYSASINYVEPVGSSRYLYFKLKRDQSFHDNTKLFYDGAFISDNAFNQQLSNGFDRNLFRNVVGLKYQVNKNKGVYSAGVDAQMTELDNQDLINSNSLRSRYWSVLPNASLSWKLASTTNMEAQYQTRIQVPEIRQLQPVLDNSDPLQLYQGDPSLDPEYAHQFRLSYSNFNQFYFRSFFASVRGELTGNAIAEQETTDQDLVTTRTPVNSNSEWQVNGDYDYSSPFNNINFKFRLDGEYGIQQGNVLINELSDRLSINTLQQRVRLENKKKKVLDWAVGARTRARLIRYRQLSVFDQNLINVDVFTDIKLKFLKHWRVELKASQRTYLSNEFVGRTELFFLQGELSRSFLDKALQFYVRGVNLLDETRVVERSAFGNSYSEVLVERLGRIVLVGVSYRIRSFGK